MRRSIQTLALCAALAVGCVGAIGDSLPGGGASQQPATASNPMLSAACSPNYAPGHVPIHRLTNSEYNNTVRDLLFTTTTPADAFDSDPPGLSGYENDSAGESVSDNLLFEYNSAADGLSKEVIASKGVAGGAYGKIVTCAPSAACAQTTIANLLTLAYRRPVTSAEVALYMGVFNADSDFDTGLQDVINSILVSPKFLFVYFTSPQSQIDGQTFSIDDYGLAARLSYALWQTMPDATLLQLAQSGQLHEPSVLQAQLVRMLGDPKVTSMLISLRNDWAGLSAFADPSGSLMGLDDNVRMAMVGEVDAFLSDMVRSDVSPLNLLTADYSFVNQTMATYYGVPFTGTDPNAYTRVPIPPNRTGILTSPAIMAATSGDVAYTHAVHRGLFIARRITCQPPPPPPPKVPAVNFDPASGGGTPRQKLAAHVSQGAACSGCHSVMDIWGLGLENYDPLGNWRAAYPGTVGPVDPSGTMPSPDGRSFTTPTEMIADLAQDAQTQSCLASQIFAYVLTRALSSSDDQCVATTMGAKAVTSTGKFSDLMTMIVESHQFLMQTGEAP